MLGSFRKFSTSIYAKILMGIVVIPFVFWGMGSVFTSGNKNVVVVIEKDKFSVQDFANFISKIVPSDQKLTSQQTEKLLSSFIGNKLIEKEIKEYGIKLSDNSLRDLLKSQEVFKRNNEFSRIEYEKFLLENNTTASSFEENLKNNEKKKQLLELIGGGIIPNNLLINSEFNKINKKINIDLINLNNIFEKKFNYSENEIVLYYKKNKNEFSDIFKEVKILELTPNNLTEQNEFNNIFFEKIDTIDDLIAKGEELDSINQEFNLKNSKTFIFNKFGKDMDYRLIKELPENFAKDIFALDKNNLTALVEKDNKYFILEIVKTEKIVKKFEDEAVKRKILLNLKNKNKRNLISKIISNVNTKSFSKSDFDTFAVNENVNIQEISLKSLNDDKILTKEIVNQIYKYPEKSIIVIHDINLEKNFLVHINLIEKIKINEETEEYNKFSKVSKIRITTGLFNTYDKFLKEKYEIDINKNALNTVKNYFN